MNIETLSAADQVRIFNAVTGQSVKKFASRAIGANRIGSALAQAGMILAEVDGVWQAQAKPAEVAPPKADKPASKLALVAAMLTSKTGTTAAEILAATGWPAVSVPQMARQAKLTLRSAKDGRALRYHAVPMQPQA